MMQEDEIIYEASGVIEETNPEVVEVEIFEAFQAPTTGDEFNHALLTNREIHDAHPITAITGLREELDSIEALQTVYSDKKGNADYYEWADGHALGENGVGYFVSLNEDTRTISICTGVDIFGVVVDSAAFVGGQDNVARDAHYGLVMTNGATHVRCELDVAVDDYVVSNAYGVATKSGSNRGYKVVALHDIKGVPHAMINLNISADQVSLMGAEIQNLDSRMDAAETNIVSAINVSNEAYKKSSEIGEVSEEAIQKALDAVLKAESVEGTVNNINDTLSSVSTIAAQARVIAEGAVTAAASMKEEAVEEANKALEEASELRDDFKFMEQQITDVEDQVTIATNRIAGKYTTVSSWSKAGKETDVVYYAEDTKLYWYYDNHVWKNTTDAYTAGLPMAVSGIQVKVDDNSSSINSLTSWQGETNMSMARIEQKADANGAYIQSTVANIDKYSVGPHSQAYGFTLEQAIGVLEEGMIYAPTEAVTEEYLYANKAESVDAWEETDKDKAKVYSVYNSDTETTTYWYCSGYDDTNQKCTWSSSTTMPKYTRTFTPTYIYKWGQLNGVGPYRWVTVDKNYSDTDKTNTSAPVVYFTTNIAPAIGEDDDYGYWYTNGSTLTGTASTYEPYTLYKWDLPYKYQTKDDDGEIIDVEEYRWVAVATLAGNSQNRAVSQIRQDANSIELSVTNVKGDVASSKNWIDDNDANIQDVVSWKNDNGESLVTFVQTAGDNFASSAQVAQVVDKDGNINAASIVAAVNEAGSSVVIEAEHVNLKGKVTFESFDATTKQQIEADSIEVQIWSSRGNIFKSRDVSTVLTCHVFKAGIDITDTLPNTAFKWTKINHDGSTDETWTATPYGNYANAIQISSEEVFNRAIFNCEVEIEYK